MTVELLEYLMAEKSVALTALRMVGEMVSNWVWRMVDVKVE